MQQFFSLLSWRLFTAQQVSGIFPPIIRSSMTAVAASGFTFVSWWQSCCLRGRAGRAGCAGRQALRLCTGRTANRGSRGIALLFHDHGTGRGEESASHPGRSLPPGKPRYQLYRRLGGPQGRSGQVRKISPSPEFDPQTVQPVASRYTDWATRLTIWKNPLIFRTRFILRDIPWSSVITDCSCVNRT
jgi:hypothetical protein